MPHRRWLIILVIAGIALGFLAIRYHRRFNSPILGPSPQVAPAVGPIDGTAGSGLDMTSLGRLVSQSLDQAVAKPLSGMVRIGITSHHLPVAAPLIAEFYKGLQAISGPRRIFVVMGPDHYLHCQAPLSTTERSYRTPFGELSPNRAIVQELLQHGAKINDGCFDGEHSMAVEAVFIKKLFPDATIVPLLFAPTVPPEIVSGVAQALAEHTDIAVIVSVDFNHYQPVARATHMDNESAEFLRKLQAEKISAKHLDSPGAVRVALALARAWNETQVHVLRRANSYEFTGNPENTTGYMNVMFTE